MSNNTNKASENNNFYESESYVTIERAILAEDVKFTKFVNLVGKFYIKVMTPTVDTSSVQQIGAQTNFVELGIPAYMLLQFMNPTIEKIVHDPKEPEVIETGDTVEEQDHLGKDSENEIVFTFETDEFVIPKGTVFLVEFVGGEIEIEKVQIIGIEIAVSD